MHNTRIEITNHPEVFFEIHDGPLTLPQRNKLAEIYNIAVNPRSTGNLVPLIDYVDITDREIQARIVTLGPILHIDKMIFPSRDLKTTLLLKIGEPAIIFLRKHSSRELLPFLTVHKN